MHSRNHNIFESMSHLIEKRYRKSICKKSNNDLYKYLYVKIKYFGKYPKKFHQHFQECKLKNNGFSPNNLVIININDTSRELHENVLLASFTKLLKYPENNKIF